MNAISTTFPSNDASMRRDDSGKRSGARLALFSFVMLLAIVVPVEIVSTLLLYATRGSIVSGAVGVALLLNIGAIFLYAIGRPAAAITLASVLSFGIIGFAVWDGYGLLRVQQEAVRALSYVYETRVRTGELPADLQGYRWQSPDLAGNIHYTQQPAGAFTVVYSVSGSSSNYWYSSSDGWHYYDD